MTLTIRERATLLAILIRFDDQGMMIAGDVDGKIEFNGVRVEPLTRGELYTLMYALQKQEDYNKKTGR